MSQKDKPATAKKETPIISFRLDSYHFGRLETDAKKYSVSVHEQARRMVIDDLSRQETGELLEKLTAIQKQTARVESVETSIAELRSDLAEAVDWIVKKLERK